MSSAAFANFGDTKSLTGVGQAPLAEATRAGDVSATESVKKDFPKELQGMGAIVDKYSQKAFLAGYSQAFNAGR